jgi:hypothetical protein
MNPLRTFAALSLLAVAGLAGCDDPDQVACFQDPSCVPDPTLELGTPGQVFGPGIDALPEIPGMQELDAVTPMKDLLTPEEYAQWSGVDPRDPVPPPPVGHHLGRGITY